MIWGKRNKKSIWMDPPEGAGPREPDILESPEQDAMSGQEPMTEADIDEKQASQEEAVALSEKGKHSGGSRSRRYRGRHLGLARRVLLPRLRRPGRHSATGAPPAGAPAPIAPEEGQTAVPEDEAAARARRREEAERELEALLAPDTQEDVEVIAVEEPETAPEPQAAQEPEAGLEPESELPIAPEYFFESAPEPEPESGPEHVYELEPDHVYELEPEPEPDHIYELEPEPESEREPEPEQEHDFEPAVFPVADAEADTDIGATEAAWTGPEVMAEPGIETAPEQTPDTAQVETESDQLPDRGPVERESRASRRAAIEQQRWGRRKKRSLAAAAAVLIVAAVLGGWLLVGGGNKDEKTRTGVGSRDSLSVTDTGPVTTLLFGTRRAESGGSQAVWLTLLTADPSEDRGSVVYIPAHTAVDVPGRGLQGVGESYSSGGVSLLLLSVENLLGIDIDRYAELPYEDGQALFGATGELTVEVPGEVRVAAGNDQTRLIFVEGPQNLNPEMVARLLYEPGIDGDDIEVGGRHLAFWDALLDRFESDPASLGDAVAEAESALASSDAEPEEHAAMFETLAGLGSGELTLAQLPVRPISAGDSQLYAAEAAELTNFIEDTIGIPVSTQNEVRVQILNGNGVPGIGQKVARELVGHGFRVLLSGNARELTHRRTLIVTYDPTNAGRATAQRAKELLGVGQVQVSAQQQGIVDLTIVVGKDFLRT